MVTYSRYLFAISNFLMKQNPRDTGIGNGKVYENLNWADEPDKTEQSFTNLRFVNNKMGLDELT